MSRRASSSRRKNEENNYWEYSSDDLMKLTDVLFYRTMNLTMKEIKLIMGGLHLEDIGAVIDQRKSDMIGEIKELVSSLSDLDLWQEKLPQGIKPDRQVHSWRHAGRVQKIRLF